MVSPLFVLWFLCLSAFLSAKCPQKTQEKYISGDNTDLSAAVKFLRENDRLAEKVAHETALASWNYQSNITDYNKKEYIKKTKEKAEFDKDTWKTATSYSWKEFEGKNYTFYRWFKLLSVLGPAALPSESLTKFYSAISNMQAIHAKAKVCRYLSEIEEPCDLSLEPGLSGILEKSTNYDELKHVWKNWRDETGGQVKKDFLLYVKLSNQAACLNGFSDMGELWREEFESDNFSDEVDELWKKIQPLYKQLHAYVRKKLIQLYSTEYIKPYGPIPAHLLGNMWGQAWQNIYERVAPYPNKKVVDVTDAMKMKNTTVLDIFKISETFFTSLGLKQMTPKFWNRSIFERPDDGRHIQCHPSAWNLYDNGDFRVKMCTRVDTENLVKAHHEMGHVEYFIQYQHQPVVFRKGANSGFHEAVGDVMTLSVVTPIHLKKIGFLKEVSHDNETEINTLMKMALLKIAFIPFSYIMDIWRWKIFDGSIKEDELNTQWWKLRYKYQGLCPPILRTEDDLDAASKLHIAGNVPYIRYFISFIIQFQFHKALCEEAGHVGPLNKCDIYKSKKAGKLLSNVLQLGSSMPWRAAMKIITKGKTDKMEAEPMLEYFQPLHEWLKEENADDIIGWHSDDPMTCP